MTLPDFAGCSSVVPLPLGPLNEPLGPLGYVAGFLARKTTVKVPIPRPSANRTMVHKRALINIDWRGRPPPSPQRAKLSKQLECMPCKRLLHVSFQCV